MVEQSGPHFLVYKRKVGWVFREKWQLVSSHRTEAAARMDVFDRANYHPRVVAIFDQYGAEISK